MRVYLYENYACDEWVTGCLKNHRKSLVKKHGLKSLSFSYSLPSNGGVEIMIKEDSEVAKALKESIKKIISNY